jgi:dTDP-4-amino-4,6-dideoxygalactose transaminase
MNEVQAAMGLLQLRYIEEAIAKRRKITSEYRTRMSKFDGVTFFEDIDGVKHNYGYFPVLIDETRYGASRDELYERLKQHNIYTRRYFYPLISQFPTYRGLASASEENLPVATRISGQILCLPLYPDMDVSDVERVLAVVERS